MGGHGKGCMSGLKPPTYRETVKVFGSEQSPQP